MIFISELLGTVISIFVTIIVFYKWSFQYWKKRNFPYLEPSVPFGNLQNSLVIKKPPGIQVKELYDSVRSRGWKHAGVYFFTSPKYLVTDLDYLKNILTKDFQHFTDRGIFYNEKDDFMSAHLFNVGGSKWRKLRVKLTPTFTSGKMKMMFQTLLDCEANFQEKMKRCYERGEPIDIKDVAACFTTDAIGSCAFGLECESIKDENSPFRTYGKNIFNTSKLRTVKRIFCDSFPKAAVALKVTTNPTDIVNFYQKIVTDTIKYRDENNLTRKDFLQLLMELRNSENNITMDEIIAQSFVFFAAGFETSSTLMTFTLYELARNRNIQDKVREEVEKVLASYQGQITYDAIQDMKYLQQVIDETLRMYPPLPLITRKCVKSYKIPDEDLIIEKGTSILISIMGIQRDEEYYHDPEKFDPNRFTEENKKNRNPYTHIPFGEGPRLCIGMRFGLLQAKIGLISLLRKYKFSVNKKTKEPITYQAINLVLAVEGDIWLDAEQV